MELANYVLRHAVRGACTCGRCIDAPEHPEAKQPSGHVIDLTFFKVAKTGGDKDEFLSLVMKEYPDFLNGKEHNYLQVSADMGDQGIALLTIGFGHLLGVWQALTPETVLPFLPDDLKQKMAERGMISLQFDKNEAKPQEASHKLNINH